MYFLAPGLKNPPHIGQIVMASYHGAYYHGQVESVDGQNVRIVFLDYGDETTVKYSEIIEPNRAIMEVSKWLLNVHNCF